LFFIVAYAIYGSQPKVGASADTLVSFYDGDRTRILIASVIFGIGILNLLWFAAALSNELRAVGQGTWAAAATAASAAVGVIFFLLIMVSATLAYSIAGSGTNQLTSGLNDFSWVLMVVARIISPIVALAWIAVVSGLLYMRSPSTVSTRERAAVTAS
jgi:hypothetical protein